MEDFNNNSNNTPSGELNGFDSVNPANNNEGYTVTPNGSFYNKQKDDIIQDEVFSNSEQPKTEESQSSSQFSQDNVVHSAPSQKYYHRQPSNTPPKKRKNKKRFGGATVVLASFLAAVIGVFGGAGTVYFLLNRGNSSTLTSDTPQKNVNITISDTAESVAEAVAQKVTPSVVGIRTTTSVISFFGGTSESSGDGSGVIYSEDGYIITNYHVVANAITNQNASKIEVFLDSDSSKAYQASIVGYKISADLAVIKIDAKGLDAIEVAKSEDLKVGQYVITVGNPGGLEFMDSVTFGIISGLNRVVSADSGIELIQTDAAINPGNSGGALVNTKGELVGINSSKIVSEEFEGMGFAIPSNTVVKICDNIISKENSPEPYVGITISERYTPSVLKYYNFPVGAVVLSVADGSPADSAGIEKGDIITEFGDTQITEYAVLYDAIKNYSPGEKVTVKLYRSGRYYTTKLTVAANNAID